MKTREEFLNWVSNRWGLTNTATEEIYDFLAEPIKAHERPFLRVIVENSKLRKALEWIASGDEPSGKGEGE